MPLIMHELPNPNSTSGRGPNPGSGPGSTPGTTPSLHNCEHFDGVLLRCLIYAACTVMTVRRRGGAGLGVGSGIGIESGLGSGVNTIVTLDRNLISLILSRTVGVLHIA